MTPPPVPVSDIGVAVTPVGAPGLVIGVKPIATEAGPVPTEFVAVMDTE